MEAADEYTISLLPVAVEDDALPCTPPRMAAIALRSPTASGVPDQYSIPLLLWFASHAGGVGR